MFLIKQRSGIMNKLSEFCLTVDLIFETCLSISNRVPVDFSLEIKQIAISRITSLALQ